MGMNEHEKMVRELELALQAARTAKAKGVLGEGADEVIRKAEEDLAKAKIYDLKTGNKLADLPTDKGDRVRTADLGYEGGWDVLHGGDTMRHPIHGEVQITSSSENPEYIEYTAAHQGREVGKFKDILSAIKGVTEHFKARPKKTVREILKADLAKAKIDEGMSDDEKQEARWKRNKPFMSGSMKRRLQTGVHHPLQYHGNDKRMAGQSETSLFSNVDSQKRRVKEITEESRKINPKLPKSEMAKEEPLKKPYASEAQRRWAHTDAGTKALGGKSKVKEWDKESKGKALPERISKSVLPHQEEHWVLQHVDEHGELPKSVDPKAHLEAGHIQADPRSPKRFALTDKGGERLRAIRAERRSLAKAKIDESLSLDAKVAARNRRGEQMERGVHPSLKYGGEGQKGTSIAGGYLSEGAMSDAKRWHGRVAEELRSMKPARLPKAEMEKAGKPAVRGHGKLGVEFNPDLPHRNMYPKTAKEQSERLDAELANTAEHYRRRPKEESKLPKSEMEKARNPRTDHSTIDHRYRHERGVHIPLLPPRMRSHDKRREKQQAGESATGMHVRTRSRLPHDLRDAHRLVLREQRRMPAPNLPKSELIKEELRKPFKPRYKKD